MAGNSNTSSQQLLIQLLNMLMMRNMIINHSHLSTAYTSTNVTHPVVIPNLLMLIVRITLPILSSIHHNLAPFFFSSDKSDARYHHYSLMHTPQDYRAGA